MSAEHDHAPVDFNRAFAIGIVLNIVFVGIEAFYGWRVNSLALLFLPGREGDLNIRGAFMHMAADALVSAGVVVAGALTLWRGWTWLDPVVSLGIAGVILWGTWDLFKQSLHIWATGTSHITLTAHLVMPQGQADDDFLKLANDLLHDRFDITHVTLQMMKEPFTVPCGEPTSAEPVTKPAVAMAHDHESDHGHTHLH